jgi:hypothetical protein
MRQEQWNQFKATAKRHPGAGIPLAMIVDSPWMPGLKPPAAVKRIHENEK